MDSKINNLNIEKAVLFVVVLSILAIISLVFYAGVKIEKNNVIVIIEKEIKDIEERNKDYVVVSLADFHERRTLLNLQKKLTGKVKDKAE